MAAKIAPGGTERAFYDAVFKPALDAAGSDVEFLGELSQDDRDDLFAESHAALMPGSWPEPFGLVAIEALATGTPVIARRIGALPEIIREGEDGFFGDDVTAMAFQVDRVEDLDREAIRASVLERFSVERMTDGYEAVYRTVLAGDPPVPLDTADGEADPGSSVIPADRLVARRSGRASVETATS
jgi:glycosyltransferase involved in cell wall biosynthesis